MSTWSGNPQTWPESGILEGDIVICSPIGRRYGHNYVVLAQITELSSLLNKVVAKAYYCTLIVKQLEINKMLVIRESSSATVW